MAWSGAQGRQSRAHRPLPRPRRPERSAGTFPPDAPPARRPPRGAARSCDGRWHDAHPGAITFRDYVENDWLPSRHIEATTRAGYRSYLDKHFLPFFGNRPMAKILPSTGAGLGHPRRR